MTQHDGIEVNKTGEHFDEEAVMLRKASKSCPVELDCSLHLTQSSCVKQAISCRYQSDPESQIGLEGAFKDQLVPTPCHGQEHVCLL